MATYGDEEEFLAVLVTNIFASECGRPHSIRADHDGRAFNELHMGVSDPQDPGYYYRINKDVIDDLGSRDPSTQSLFQDLAAVPARFNPLREWRKALLTRIQAGIPF